MKEENCRRPKLSPSCSFAFLQLNRTDEQACEYRGSPGLLIAWLLSCPSGRRAGTDIPAELVQGS